MFNLLTRGSGPVFNILKRQVVKRKINNDSTSISLHVRRNNVVNIDLGKECLLKHVKVNSVNDRKYTGLPEPIRENVVPRKVFVPQESLFAHSVLEKRAAYANTIVENSPIYYDNEITEEEVDEYINQSWQNIEVPKIIEAFKRISCYASKNDENITDLKYKKFRKYLIANCKQFTDDEMKDVLTSLQMWPVLYSRHDKEFKSLFVALDKECTRRASTWSFEQIFLFADHWHHLKLLRYSEFAVYLNHKMGNKSSRMTPNNLVQFMFYVSSSRKHPSDMYNLEYRMESCIDELDLDEIAVIAMGFFKSQKPIRNSDLLVKIIRRLIDNIDTIHEISLAAFMKIIRYSTTVQRESGIIWELLVSTIPQVPRLSLQAMVQVILVTTKTRIFQPDLLTAVADRFNKNIKDARTKDMERLALTLSVFNFNPDIQPNIFQTIVKELRTPERAQEIEQYPRSVAGLLQYLSVVNVYPQDLIALILNPENLTRTYGPSPYNIQDTILMLDLNIDVDVPDYTGPRLSSKVREIMAKLHVNKMPQTSQKPLSLRHNFMTDIMNTCEGIFGSTEALHLDWVLPQYKEADLIICLDKHNSPLNIEHLLSEIPFGSIKRRPQDLPDGSRCLAVVIGAINCYTRDSRRLLGKDFLKIIQLERIGYEPIVIPWYEWNSFNGDRKEYLKRKLYK